MILLKNNRLKIFANGKESYFDKETINITITPTGEEKEINIGDVIILRNITFLKNSILPKPILLPPFRTN